jgi:hypothetical protein
MGELQGGVDVPLAVLLQPLVLFHRRLSAILNTFLGASSQIRMQICSALMKTMLKSGAALMTRSDA